MLVFELTGGAEGGFSDCDSLVAALPQDDTLLRFADWPGRRWNPLRNRASYLLGDFTVSDFPASGLHQRTVVGYPHEKEGLIARRVSRSQTMGGRRVERLHG